MSRALLQTNTPIEIVATRPGDGVTSGNHTIADPAHTFTSCRPLVVSILIGDRAPADVQVRVQTSTGISASTQGHVDVASVASVPLDLGDAPFGPAGCGDVEDGAAPPVDGSDAAQPMDGGDPQDMSMPPSCPKPWLLVAIDDKTKPGHVARFSLAGTDPAECTPLDSEMPSRVETLTFVPPDKVLVAGGIEVVLVDANRNLALWHNGPGTTGPATGIARAVDAFPLFAPPDTTGPIAVAYTYGTCAKTCIDLVYRYSDATAPPPPWDLTSGFAVSNTNVFGMTQSPLDPSHILAGTWGTGFGAATDVDPFVPRIYHPPYVRESQADLRTISSLDYSQYTGVGHSTVWTAHGTDADGDALHYTVEANNNTYQVLSGPIYCPGAVCTSFVHATPDPSWTPRFFAICETSGGNRSLLRLGPWSCEAIRSSSWLSANESMVRLAITPPP